MWHCQPSSWHPACPSLTHRSDWQHQLGWPPGGKMPVSLGRAAGQASPVVSSFPQKLSVGSAELWKLRCQVSGVEQGRPSTQPSSSGGLSFATPRPKPDTQPRRGRYSLTRWLVCPESGGPVAHRRSFQNTHRGTGLSAAPARSRLTP